MDHLLKMHAPGKFLLLSILAIICTTTLCAQQFDRKEFNFNSGWKLKQGDFRGAEKPGFNDRNWQRVPLPYAYNQHEAFEKSIEEHTTGIVGTKKFKLLKEAEGQKIFLEFTKELDLCKDKEAANAKGQLRIVEVEFYE